MVAVKDLFDLLFGPSTGHRPVRRDIDLRLTWDDDGRLTVAADESEAFLLSHADGSIDRVHLTQDRFYSCGCSAAAVQVGGQCAEPGCRRTSCTRHFEQWRCDACGKPCCLQHTYRGDLPDVTGSHWCYRCYDQLRRRYVLRSLFRKLVDSLCEEE